MENRLFVGNLAWATEEEDLKDLFAQCGSVEKVDLMRDKFTGKARGFAFVTMSSEEEAQQCVDQLDGQDFMDRALKVNIAKPRTEGGPERRSFGGGGNGGGGRRFGGGGGGGRSNDRSGDRDRRRY